MTSTLSLILKGSLKKIKKVVIFLYIIAIPFSNIYSMNNPFYKTYNTQFEIPPFSEIEEKHYMPAFLKGMEEHNNEINEIIQKGRWKTKKARNTDVKKNYFFQKIITLSFYQ